MAPELKVQDDERAIAEAMAAALGTINYEVVTRTGAPVPHILL